MATRRRIPLQQQDNGQSNEPAPTPPSSHEVQSGDWVSAPKFRTMRVSLPAQQFSPVEYHFFSIPQLEATFEVPEGMAPEHAAERALESLRRIQQACFERELTRFLENVMNAGNIAFQVQAGNQIQRVRQ